VVPAVGVQHHPLLLLHLSGLSDLLLGDRVLVVTVVVERLLASRVSPRRRLWHAVDGCCGRDVEEEGEVLVRLRQEARDLAPNPMRRRVLVL
jgi:hypothetical protein